MSNSFNISDAAEIAEVAADIAAAIVTINANSSGLATAIISDLVDIAGQNTDISTEIAAIRSADLEAIIAEIDANETLLDTVITNIGLIKAKTDNLPQKVRSKFYMTRFNTAEAEFQDALSIDGQGQIFMIFCYAIDGDTMEVSVVPDGAAFSTIEVAAVSKMLVPEVDQTFATHKFKLIDEPAADIIGGMGNIQFDTSLLIQLRRTAGAGSGGVIKIYYSIDNF